MTKRLSNLKHGLLLLLCLLLLAIQPNSAQDDYTKNYSPEYKEYVGSYELGVERFIIIGQAFRGTLYYADTLTGRFGKIDPTSTNTFSDKRDTEVKFERDRPRGIKGLYWNQGSSEKVFAKKVGLHAEEVKFHNGNVGLNGTLVVPPKKGRHPVVIIHIGSDWKIREDFIEDCYRLASYGIGAFCYDKRGWGSSNGERNVSFEVTARDAAAAVKALQQNPNVNPKQIGLSGYSQRDGSCL